MQGILQQLAFASAQNLPQLQWDLILLLSVDFDLDGQFARGAGVGVGTRALRSATAASQPAPGIVLFGLIPEADFRLMVVKLPEAAPLLGWPGFRYCVIWF